MSSWYDKRQEEEEEEFEEELGGEDQVNKSKTV